MTREEIKARITELKELKNMRVELDGMISAIEDEIKAELTAQDTDEMIIDEYKITWKATSSSRIDMVAFRKDLPELAAKYTKCTPSRRFLVS